MDILEIRVEYVSYLLLFALLDRNQMETDIVFPFQFTLSAQLDMKVMEMAFAYWLLHQLKIHNQLLSKLHNNLQLFQQQLLLSVHACALMKLKSFKDWLHQKRLFLIHWHLHALAPTLLQTALIHVHHLLQAALLHVHHLIPTIKISNQEREKELIKDQTHSRAHLQVLLALIDPTLKDQDTQDKVLVHIQDIQIFKQKRKWKQKLLCKIKWKKDLEIIKNKEDELRFKIFN